MNRIEVYDKIRDSRGESVKKNIEEDLNIGVSKVLYVDVYLIKGNFSESQLKAAGEKLLADPISQGFTKSVKIPNDAWAIEVRYKPGVTDAVADSALK
ncbi:MAG: hypothetical protein GY861_08380, partial [bacterium]|nr:hypothetical protein [bacterium]